MRLLLDTHVFLWLKTKSPKLPKQHREAFLDPETIPYFSMASYWEITIKAALGKLDLAPDWPTDFEREIVESHIHWLPIEPNHCRTLLNLEHLHRDPFDRMLVAQALAEDLVIATLDKRIRRYPVKTL
ncbi:MAG: type II toxin-antitoxin system VapC family toxin [Xanthomonadales bacterium]|jgi:PIN domain nuclease of toxin-antitoxin system|nr:type II toxin-antitoxin system VapC family toxin [Xanthomonadales bacterium]